MIDQWIICLGAGESQLPLIRCARTLGYRVAAVDRNPRAPGFAVADYSVNESTYEPDEILAALPPYHWVGLLARCTGQALFTAAGLVQRFDIPGITTALAEIGSSKSALRDFCRHSAIAMPEGLRVRGGQSPEANAVPMPCVVKPDFTLIGKKAIRHITEAERLPEAIDEAAAASGNGMAEVQEYVPGINCTYLAFFNKGAAEVIFNGDELVYFDAVGCLRAVGVSTPSVAVALGYDAAIRRAIEAFAARFPEVRAPAAFSFRVDGDGVPGLIEVHADLTGDRILDQLAPAASGADYLQALVESIIRGELTEEFRRSCMAGEPVPTALIDEVGSAGERRSRLLQEHTLLGLHEQVAAHFPGGRHGQLQALERVSETKRVCP